MIEGIPIVDLTERTVLLIVVLMFLWGKIVPRKALEDEREDTKEWREAHRLSEEARLIQSEQTRTLLAHAETANALLQSITDRAKGAG